MVTMEEALQRIHEWRDGSSSNEIEIGGNKGVEELSFLLAAVLSTIDFDSLKRKGHTPIHALAEMDNIAMEHNKVQMRGSVKLLKDCGLDIDASRGGEDDDDEDEGDGTTPLVLAARKGRFALVQALVEEGADVNKRDRSGCVPLAAAAGSYLSESHPKIVSYLLKHEARLEDTEALHWAISSFCLESVRVLLRAGAEVNELNEDGHARTPAQICCEGQGKGAERLEALSLLLEAGANLNVKDEDGGSLLHFAAEGGHSELIDEIVRRGLEVDTKNSYQDTPLHSAAYWGKSTCVKALIHLGASLDAVDSENDTPLHLALKYGRMDAAAELIDAGANVNAKRDGNTTPLHIAAARGSMRLVYLLLEAGAEVDALTDGGKSPLMVCMSPAEEDIINFDVCGSLRGRKKVAALLLEMGAAVSKPVMALVGESDCGDVVGAYVRQEREAHESADRVCNTIAGHISSGSAYSEAAKEGRVVRVRLVDRTTGKSKDTQYTLSIPLMELLMNKTEGEGGSSDGSDRHDTAAGSLPTMLDPAGRGFMGIKGKAKDEVEVTLDGVDFTEEGFAAVVQFVTTGSVKSLLTRGRHGQLSSSSSSETVGGSGDGRGGGSSSEASGKRKRERVKLFDELRAEQALQAADFFCIEAMSREVKALMDLYGFELEEEEENDEPPREGRRDTYVCM